MAYIGSSPTKVVSRQSANIFTYTATANQTAFTGADANGNTLACSPSDLMVHMNGIKLEESDYTASTTTVTLVSGAAAGDEVTITAFLTFESADHYTKSAADTRYVNATGDTMTGALAVDAGNGDQLTLDNDGERFTQISLKNNGSQYAAVWYDNSINVLVNHAASGKGYAVQTGGSTDRLVIDSSGRVTMPYQPSFRAYLTSGSKTTSGVVLYNNIVLNTGTHYSSSNGRFTAPIAGSYMFIVTGICGENHNSTVNGDLRIRHNGTYQHRGHFNHSDRWENVSYSAVLALSASDYVDVHYGVSAGSPELYGSDKYTSFSGYLLG
tara:strand:- start:908 stop:1882 length:975 start_codon:yes stop_codon:yes gene_type:complete